MAINVTPGPIPEDGTRLDVAANLTDFLEGTTIENFGPENFTKAAVSFVVSQTDPPEIVNRAMSWFKRGEGTLYQALMFTPEEGPLSGVTQSKWLAASGSRKEQLVELRFPVEQAGGILRQTGEENTFGTQIMAHGLLVARVYQTLFTSHTDVTAFSDSTSSLLGFWAERHMDPIFVAKELTTGDCGWSGHAYAVANECGYLPLHVCGYTGAPTKVVVREGVNSPAFFTPTGATFRVEEPEVGFVLVSGGTGATLFSFFRPSLTHRNV